MNCILNSVKIQEIYSFKLMSLTDICNYLEIWDDLSEDEKNLYEEIDNIPNMIKHFSIDRGLEDGFWEKFEDYYVYGEIKKEGVQNLSESLKGLTGNFYDIGSGNGKLLLHLSLISDFDTYTGIEISKPRHLYAKTIQSSISLSSEITTDDYFNLEKKVKFICDDVMNIDISNADVIFYNDVTFPDDFRNNLREKMPSGCHYISAHLNQEDYLETIFLAVTWFDFDKNPFYLHKKK